MLKELSPEMKQDKVSLDDTTEVKKICFVCSGNTCRSPMAEAVLNFLGNGSYSAISAGTSACDGDPINERSRKALEKAGILPVPERDYREHKAAMIDVLMCESCDKIIAMEEHHFIELFSRFPEYKDKFSVMCRTIKDPFMYPQDVYDGTLENIILCIKEMFSV